jgi:small subunit ribosomal protein S17
MAKKKTKTEKALQETPAKVRREKQVQKSTEKANTAEAQLPKLLKEKRIRTHGKIFQGRVIKKFPKRVVIEFERMVYIRKYERYTKTKTKIHARLPESMENQINIGDLIRVQECRPLSKIIHFIVIEKIKDAEMPEAIVK